MRELRDRLCFRNGSKVSTRKVAALSGTSACFSFRKGAAFMECVTRFSLLVLPRRRESLQFNCFLSC